MPRPRSTLTQRATPAQAISKFGRVSKGNGTPDRLGKKPSPAVAAAASAAATIPSVAPSKPSTSTPSKKRKADHDGLLTPPRTASLPSSEDEAAAAPAKRTCRRAIAPQKKQRAVSSRQTKIDDVFRRATTTTTTTRPSHDADSLPPHLADLVDLHRAFVKAMTLQLAHNGSNVPVDVAALAPNMAMSWGKRQVTVDDVRRCIALQATPGESSPFVVSDYGRGKVCVELEAGRSATVDEDGLCRRFEDNLRRMCAERSATTTSAQDGDAVMTDVDVSLDALSLADLPQAAVANRDLGLGANPLLAKGQRALTDLRNDVHARAAERDERRRAAAANPMLNRDGSKMSLLDRLRAKQAALAAAGPDGDALTGPQLERRAALNRIPDVSATISMLTLSKPASLPRQAFPMPVVLDRLRDSLRVPISREEAAAAVRLLAAEVAPEWMRVVSLGGRENVVLQRNMQPVDRVIRERVDKMLG